MTITARQILATLGVLLAMSLTALSVWWLWSCGAFWPEGDGINDGDVFAVAWLLICAAGMAVVTAFLADENPSFTVRLPWRRRGPKATVVSAVDADRGPSC